MVLSRADKILKKIEKKAQNENLPIIGPNKGQILLEIIKDIKPKRVLEVGTLIGYSAILIGKELDNNAHLITIEIDSKKAEMAKENIKKAQLPPIVEVKIGDANEEIPRLEGKFDLVFIDAEKKEYHNYLQLIEDKLHKESVIVADNAGIYADQMRNFLEYVRFSGKYQSRYVPVGKDGLEISVKL